MADSGATGSLVPPTAATHLLTNIQPTPSSTHFEAGPHVILPNGTAIAATHTGNINIAGLPRPVTAHIVPHLTAGPILSLPQLADEGCTSTLSPDGIRISDKNGDLILTGPRSEHTGLWNVSTTQDTNLVNAPRHSPPQGLSLSALSTRSILATERTRWGQRTMCNPAISTLSRALKLYGSPIPSLNPATFAHNATNDPAISLGHLDQARQGQRSTTKNPKKRRGRKPTTLTAPADEDEEDTEANPIPPDPDDSTTARICMLDRNDGTIYGDGSGKLPAPSVVGNQYMLIVRLAGFIKLEPFARRLGSHIAQAYAKALKFFAERGLYPARLVMDNETSPELRQVLSASSIQPEYVPPAKHRRNRAERDMRTAKNHFIAAMSSTDPSFPFEAWDQTIPHLELTLNLLRPSKLDSTKSAWAGLCGPYDYNRHPIGPLGCLVVAFNPADGRDSFAQHGTIAYYVAPAFEHYRCYTVYVPATKETRIVETLSWHPVGLREPGATWEDDLITHLQTAIDNKKQLTPALYAVLRRTLTADEQRVPADPLTPTTDEQERVTVSPTTAPTAAQERVPASQPTMLTAEPHRVEPLPPPVQSVPPVAAIPSQRPPPGGNNTTFAAINARTRASKRKAKETATAQPPAAAQQAAKQATANKNTSIAELTRLVRADMKGSHSARAKLLALRPTLQLHAIAIRSHCQAQATTAAEAAMTARRISRGQHRRCLGSRRRLFLATVIAREAQAAAKDDAYTASTTAAAPKLRQLKLGPDGHLYEKADEEEWLRLSHHGTHTIDFVHHSTLPKGRRPAWISSAYRIKTDTGKPVIRVRHTYGKAQTPYLGPTEALTADSTTVRLHLNSVISDPNRRYSTLDAKDFYLMTDKLQSPEYMWAKLGNIPQATQQQFGLPALATPDGRILIKIIRGIYGLPQAGRLAQAKLFAHLAAHGYKECKNTPCLFRHATRNISFTLVVDDFGVGWSNRDDLDHLIATLQLLYKLTINLSGTRYLGLTLTWDYTQGARSVAISMPDYIREACTKYNITPAKRSTNNAGIHVPHKYGGAVQYTEIDSSPALSPARKLRIQGIVGTLLYYARMVDGTMLAAVGQLSSSQANATEDTEARAHHLMQYALSWPDATVTYYPSDMLYRFHSDASYLSEPKARSRAAGLHYLSNSGDNPPINGPIAVLSTVLDVVVSSSCEAEYGALYTNGRLAVPIRNTLEDLGYPQPPTIGEVDNKIATQLVNDEAKQKRSKAVDMRYHWMRDRVRQGQFKVIWREGTSNLADFPSKIHPTPHFLAMRKFYVSYPSAQSIAREGVLFSARSTTDSAAGTATQTENVAVAKASQPASLSHAAP